MVARGMLTHRDDLGEGTSEQAEWLALLEALSLAGTLGARDILLLGDSRPVVAQASGRAACRDAFLRSSLDRLRQESAQFERVRVRWIRRTQNLAGIALARIHG